MYVQGINSRYKARGRRAFRFLTTHVGLSSVEGLLRVNWCVGDSCCWSSLFLLSFGRVLIVHYGEGYYVVGGGLLRLGLTLACDLDSHALDRGVLVLLGVKITRTLVPRNQVPS